jgi:hypothetical protein
MTRYLSLAAVAALAVAACGDNSPPPLAYSNPGNGKLRLVRNDAVSRDTVVVLDLIVGDQPLTGYSVGFDLPLDDTRVELGGFTAGSALDPGTAPPASLAKLPTTGPLAHQLVTAQSHKASGGGAVSTDTKLAAGALLYSIELDLIADAKSGVVFDGTAAGFALPSGGMRDRSGTTVVAPADVAIGKLFVTR